MSDVEQLKAWRRLLGDGIVTVQFRGIRYTIPGADVHLDFNREVIQIGPDEYAPGAKSVRLTAIGTTATRVVV